MRVQLAAAAAILGLIGTGCANTTSGAELAAILQGAGSETAAPAPTGTGEDFSSESLSPGGESTDPITGGEPVPASPGGTPGPSGRGSVSSAGSGAAAGAPAGQGRPAPKSAAAAPAGAAGPDRPAGSGGAGAARQATPAPGQPPARAGQVPAPTPDCNRAPIKIASVGQLSGVLGDVFRPITKGAQAWVSAKNAAGGLNCHPITYLTADDGGDPARHQTLVRRMVESEGVIAFVPMTAPITARASKDYLNQQKVPVIGSEGAQMFFYESPMHFPTTTVDEPLFETQALIGGRATVPQGKTKAATFTCQEIEACNAAEAAYVRVADKAGYEIVLKGKTSLASPDLTSFCLQARNAGADVILGGADGASYRRLKRDCAKLDYKPTVVLASGQAQDVFPQAPEMEGSIVTMFDQPWFYDTPAAAEYRAAVQQHVTGDFSNAGGIHGWTAAKAFEAAAKGIGPADQPSAAAVLAGLYRLGGNDLGGLTYPLDFTPGKPAPVVRCGWIVVVGKGEWTSPIRERLCF